VLRSRVTLLALVAMTLPAVAGACGESASAPETLPPIVTTTTTTTTIAPSTTIPELYEIQPGDTLRKIADEFGVSMEDIINLNQITNPDKIEAGQRIKIPTPGMVIPTTTTETTVAP